MLGTGGQNQSPMCPTFHPVHVISQTSVRFFSMYSKYDEIAGGSQVWMWQGTRFRSVGCHGTFHVMSCPSPVLTISSFANFASVYV